VWFSKDVDFDGGDDFDTLSFGAFSGETPTPPSIGAVVDLAAGTAANPYGGTLTFESIEDLTGTVLADDLRGDDGYNSIVGNGGYDTLFGRGGNDELFLTLGARGPSDNFRVEGGAGVQDHLYIEFVPTGGELDVFDLLRQHGRVHGRRCVRYRDLPR
jgi:hypothetical protein